MSRSQVTGSLWLLVGVLLLTGIGVFAMDRQPAMGDELRNEDLAGIYGKQGVADCIGCVQFTISTPDCDLENVCDSCFDNSPPLNPCPLFANEAAGIGTLPDTYVPQPQDLEKNNKIHVKRGTVCYLMWKCITTSVPDTRCTFNVCAQADATNPVCRECSPGTTFLGPNMIYYKECAPCPP
jgi:hypothetical protein